MFGCSKPPSDCNVLTDILFVELQDSHTRTTSERMIATAFALDTDHLNRNFFVAFVAVAIAHLATTLLFSCAMLVPLLVLLFQETFLHATMRIALFFSELLCQLRFVALLLCNETLSSAADCLVG